MVGGGRNLLCLTILAVLLLLFGVGSALADKISLRAEFDGLAGLRVLTLHSDIEEDGDRYVVTSDYATSGIAGLLVYVKTHAEVRGLLRGAAAQPVWFGRTTQSNSNARNIRVDYGDGGAVTGMANPPLTETVPAEAIRGTVDNLTAYLLLERQLVRTGKCGLTVPVFDGIYRYDLYFTDAGNHVLQPTGGQNFQGKTIACHMRREMLAPLGGSELNQGARQGTIWYARLIPNAGAMVPVRMSMETQIGSVDGYLAEIHGPGVDLALMK